MKDAPGRYSVRGLVPDDFLDVADLGRSCLAMTPPWGAEHLAARLRLFADGQIVAVDAETGIVSGSVGSLIIPWEVDTGEQPLDDLTAGPAFACHDPLLGNTLLVADLYVEPNEQEVQIHAALSRAVVALAARLGLPQVRLAWRPTVNPWTQPVPLAALPAAVGMPQGEPALSPWLDAGFAVTPIKLAHAGIELPVYEWQNLQKGQSWQDRFGLAPAP